MDLALYGKFVLALAAVLALIALLAFAMRRLGLAPRVTARSGNRRRVAVTEVLALDAKRRLVLVRRDNVEHLLLLGATQDAVIETGVPPLPETGTPLDPTVRQSDSR